MKKRIALLLTVVAVLAWAVLFRPLFLGGPASFVIVSGVSMRPTMHTGDLAVLHRESEYAPGDVVAFKTPEGGLIIHRIVGGDAEQGFVMQGDNRDHIDEWHPKPDDILGSLWLHAPGLGDRLLWLKQPQNIGMLMAALIAVPILYTTDTRLRRRRGHPMAPKHQNARPASDAGGNTLGEPPGGWPVFGGLVAAGGLFLLLGVLGVLAWRQPATETEQATIERYTHSASFDFTFLMAPSTLYPTGRVRGEAAEDGPVTTSQPVYTRLADELVVNLDYLLEGAALEGVSGTVAAELLVRAGEDGWVQTSVLSEPEAFIGTSLERTFRFDLAQVSATIARIEEEIGYSAGSYELVLAPRLDVTGTAAGQPFEGTFTPQFVSSYSETQIDPGATSVTEPVTATEINSSGTHVGLGPVSLPTVPARWLAILGAPVALAVAAGLAAVAFLGLGRDEETRIRARYGSMLLAVDGAGRSPEQAIRVATFEDLVRVAKLDGSLVLHASDADGHRYFVRSGLGTYEYVVSRDTSMAESSRGTLHPRRAEA
ncbi:MAG: signal peptidase I [Dehalococcoidia bacterium]|nr:signal peptidase I [Dehalococcoidia bacterium]